MEKIIRGKNVSIKLADANDINKVSPLIAKFRVELKAFNCHTTKEDIDAARKEFAFYINEKNPVYFCEMDGEYVGYLVCRIEKPTVWVESLFVLSEYRRLGIASALFDIAEETATFNGGDTLYNYVHPNNDAMISFLRSKGYNTLNLIEIRKQREGESTNEIITIRNNTFNY